MDRTLGKPIHCHLGQLNLMRAHLLFLLDPTRNAAAALSSDKKALVLHPAPTKPPLRATKTTTRRAEVRTHHDSRSHPPLRASATPSQARSRVSNACASFPDVPSAGQVLLLLAVAEAAGRPDGASRSLSCRRSADAEQESARALPPRGRGGGGAGAAREGGGGEGRRRRGRRRHHVVVRPERGDQGGEGAPQGVPEGGEGGGEDAAGVAGGRERRRRRGQVPEGRRLRQGVHQGVPGWMERPAGRCQRGVLCCVGEGHQIVGGVLLQGRTLRLASRRRQKQDPGRPQHRRRLSLDLYIMLWSIVHLYYSTS